jgi:hypothetical protein
MSANVRSARPNTRRRARARGRPRTNSPTHPRLERRPPTTTRPGRRPVAARPRQTRRRTTRSADFEITVTGKPRPDPDLDLIAQALLIVARDLASKPRKGPRE